jgi:hypothetical protein
MLPKLLIGGGLMALSVIIHAAGVTAAVRGLRDGVTGSPRSWSGIWLVIRLAGFMILLHLVEIAAWGVVYVWRGAMPDVPSALYFSAVTYTTTGYGDLVLPPDWRLVGAIEALTGILMCGLSTGFFFAVLSRMVRDESAPGG